MNEFLDKSNSSYDDDVKSVPVYLSVPLVGSNATKNLMKILGGTKMLHIGPNVST